MRFNLRQVPFSRYGSYMAISHLDPSRAGREGLYLRNVHGQSPAGLRPIFRIELVRGDQVVRHEEAASPSVLRLAAEGGYAEFCFAEPDVLRVRAEGVTVRLTVDTGVYDNAIPRKAGRWQVTHFSAAGANYMITALKGTLAVDAPWREVKSEHIVIDLAPGEGVGDWAIEEFVAVWREHDYTPDFAACVKAVDAAYQAWLEKTPAVPAAYAEARELAAYVNWSSVIDARGHLKRAGMLMSKNWMTSIWTWDHCFNAMALIYDQPALAWDQFMVPFDVQHESGVLPDSVNDRVLVWSYRKPPIHGWTLKKLMARSAFVDRARLQEIYAPLCRWTAWWLDYMDDDGDGIPQYLHGNDSGWDNSTVFAIRPPIESPDLCAFLVIQMEVLAEVARLLDKGREADAWLERSKDLLKRLLDHSWRSDRFVAPRSGDHEAFDADSLLLFVPIVLGKRLPAEVLAHLVAGLKDSSRFLTPHGLATEAPRSPFYVLDGYWRGPIWAPSTMIVIDGLAAAGETDFARELSRRFCDMVARSGMAENFDALTGEGLRDRAYTWTSSVFLILAHEFLAG